MASINTERILGVGCFASWSPTRPRLVARALRNGHTAAVQEQVLGGRTFVKNEEVLVANPVAENGDFEPNPVCFTVGVVTKKLVSEFLEEFFAPDFTGIRGFEPLERLVAFDLKLLHL